MQLLLENVEIDEIFLTIKSQDRIMGDGQI